MKIGEYDVLMLLHDMLVNDGERYDAPNWSVDVWEGTVEDPSTTEAGMNVRLPSGKKFQIVVTDWSE